MGFKAALNTAKNMFKSFTKGFSNFVNTKLRKQVPKLEGRIKAVIVQEFVNSDEYEALVNGPLDAHFGFPKGSSGAIVEAIISELAKSLYVDFEPFVPVGREIRGALNFRAINADFSHILDLPEAQVITEKGESLPWLSWMLTRGDEIIITQYKIVMKPFDTPPSRSGKAIMTTAVNGVWRVPPEFSGTRTNNWVTKTVDRLNERVLSIITEEVQRIL